MAKTFIKHDFEPLVKVDLNGARTYRTPTGQAYPSVTTVTALHSEVGIKKWRDRVGNIEANKIAGRASSRGRTVHSLCESYLLGEETKPSAFDREVFDAMLPHLDKIDNIHCLETPLYSHHLEVAGTVDCIGEYEGKLNVIDFKTAAKPKKHEWIHNYFMQTSAYAVMFEELTELPVGRLLILIGIDDHEPQIFQEKRNDWIFEFRKLREQYKKRMGI